jgi:hypothetical protein
MKKIFAGDAVSMIRDINTRASRVRDFPEGRWQLPE